MSPDDKPLPIVFERDGKVYANSRDVAACFEKEHKHVLRDIRDVQHQMRSNLLINNDGSKIGHISDERFIASTYTDGAGRRQDQFDMTRDGFALLAMGFTGAKALIFKLRYIEQFNAMESALKNRPQVDPMRVLDDMGTLKRWSPRQLPRFGESSSLNGLRAGLDSRVSTSQRRDVQRDDDATSTKGEGEGEGDLSLASGDKSPSAAAKAREWRRAG